MKQSALAIAVVWFLAATAYAFLSLFGRAPMSIPIFLSLLLGIVLTNLLALWAIWRGRQRLRLVGQVKAVVWTGIAVWYWFFAAIYFVLTMNLDALQLRWTAFIFLWEVAVFGLLFLLFAAFLFRPIQRFLDEKAPSDPSDPRSQERLRAIHRKIVRYPLVAAISIAAFTLVGFAAGTWQFSAFAAGPAIEAWKNFLNGVAVSFFPAIFYYLILAVVLADARAKLEERLSPPAQGQGSIAFRILSVFGLVALSSLLLLQLVVFKSLQSVVVRSVETQMSQNVELRHWDPVSVGPNANVFTIRTLDDLAKLDASPETRAFIAAQTSGVIEDLHHSAKVVGFYTDMSGARSVVFSYLDDFYGPVWAELATLGAASLFVVLLTLGAGWIVTSALTRPLRLLISAVRSGEPDKPLRLPPIASGDEIQELASTIAYYAEQEAQVDHAKSEFVSIASHQLRTPMTELQWVVEALKKEPSAARGKYFDDISDAVDHLSEIIRLLLNASRLEGGKMSFSPAPSELVSFLSPKIGHYRSMAARRGVSLSFVHADAALPLFTDTAAVDIALEALVSNALQYTPTGGLVKVELLKTPEGAKLSVADSGIGIPEDEQEAIFTKFHRAKNALLVRTDGTGLGLYVAREAMRMVGGDISFSSKQGKGTTFIVNMPDRAPKGEVVS